MYNKYQQRAIFVTSAGLRSGQRRWRAQEDWRLFGWALQSGGGNIVMTGQGQWRLSSNSTKSPEHFSHVEPLKGTFGTISKDISGNSEDIWDY
jgi:hypothetical protein